MTSQTRRIQKINKIAPIVLALAAFSGASMAASTEGGYFINADLGQSQYRLGRSEVPGYHQDDTGVVAAVRFGYYWQGALNFGIETGYVDLGKQNDSYTSGDYSLHEELSATGWIFGVNSRYRFDDRWYISTRVGVLRSTVNQEYAYRNLPYGPFHGRSGYGSTSGVGTGWYAGIGGGYDLTADFSVGLHYDNYHVKRSASDQPTSGNISAFTAQLEYRF